LFRLVLIEDSLLVAIGASLGAGLAYAGLKAFIAAAPVELPRIGDAHMDARVLLFAVAAALLSTLICGVCPAGRLARADPQGALKGIPKQGRTSLSLFHLVSAEVALTTLLLVVGGLLLLSFYRVMRVPKGFEAAHVITQDVTLGGANYSEDRNRTRFVDEALRRIGQIPGVQAVGATNWLPVRGETWICELRDADSANKRGVAPANFRFVSPGYWAAMGIPLEQGRFITASDRGRAVGVISERAARFLWPGQDPIGKRVGGCGDSEGRPLEVVGVASDVRAGMEKEPPPIIYAGYWDASFGSRSFVVRTQADAAPVMIAVRAVLRSLDPDVPLPPAASMERIVDESVAPRRFQMELAVAFAMTALALASLGVYGVISFAVARRTPEIGIRIALGARAPRLAAMVLRQGMTPVLIGFGAGLACALLVGRFIAGQLYGVAARDPFTISAVAAILLGAAAAACWIPARRAMRVDPQTALRFE
jgi:predicted permease